MIDKEKTTKLIISATAILVVVVSAIFMWDPLVTMFPDIGNSLELILPFTLIMGATLVLMMVWKPKPKYI